MTEKAYTPSIGDIFILSFGYDETHVNAFQITRISTTGKTVFVREISTRDFESDEYPVGISSQYVVPVKNSFAINSQWTGTGNPESRKTVRFYGEHSQIRIDNSGHSAYLWNGKPQHTSRN